MDRFKVEERGSGEPCFIVVEDSPLQLELGLPGDFQHAWRVASFLNENVREIVSNSQHR